MVRYNEQNTILRRSIQNNIDIIGSSQTVRDVCLTLEREANKVGLKINESKTKYKYMIAAWRDRPVRNIGQSVEFGDKTFEVNKAE
jgi:hypothetical protein